MKISLSNTEKSLHAARTSIRSAQLETLLIDGLDSGQDIEFSRQFWKDLKTEASHLLKKHRKITG